MILTSGRSQSFANVAPTECQSVTWLLVGVMNSISRSKFGIEIPRGGSASNVAIVGPPFISFSGVVGFVSLYVGELAVSDALARVASRGD